MSLTNNRLYLNGAISARAFLCRTRADMQTHGQRRLGMLREQLTYFSEHAYPQAFVKGFIDAIDAYLSMSLGGSDVDPRTWEVLAAIERRQITAA
ncbi:MULTISPECIES: hypothetical protein [Ralstonia]|uniref:hypothetical protein n=1 Tax=Ralstonia TaxID=48736 RepID=UPI0007AFF985|nr:MULTISPECIES: hypothetical protein [Ralstonia]ANA33492.1 hypothetical protein VZ52_08815 [Ralstonia mannitolilytica]PLT16225.1 hypothetical protein CXP34_18905 [Ralstonia mannitolilytica]CAJ0681910.1 hypothetical protein R82526_01473 [Ralstonia mannitolilytica]CAJ0865088.1 hypothetical protein R76727_01876 [Ralstonia mannitolilytica]